MSTREFVFCGGSGVGKAIFPMISDGLFVRQTSGGTATSPITTLIWPVVSSPRREEQPTTESNNAHNAPPIFATRSRNRRSRDGQFAVNIVPSTRRWNRPQNFPSFSRTSVSICTRVMADRLKTCLEHCPQNRARSSPDISFQRALHGEATRISSTLIVIFIRGFDGASRGILPEILGQPNLARMPAVRVEQSLRECGRKLRRRATSPFAVGWWFPSLCQSNCPKQDWSDSELGREEAR